jgi:hypothetical protein
MENAVARIALKKRAVCVQVVTRQKFQALILIYKMFIRSTRPGKRRWQLLAPTQFRKVKMLQRQRKLGKINC